MSDEAPDRCYLHALNEITALRAQLDAWRNCFICIECGRVAVDEDGCCVTCGRDCIGFAEGAFDGAGVAEHYDGIEAAAERRVHSCEARIDEITRARLDPTGIDIPAMALLGEARGVTIYNPHLLERDELVASFVARQPLLDELLEDLRRGGAQHHLLIGDRGAGKTTLLLRLAVAIEDDPKLGKKWVPLRFPEEQYNVSHLADFWLNVADALVDALERAGDREGGARVEAEVARIEALVVKERAGPALALLATWVRQQKRRIVLLVDNLDLILERLQSAQWALREVLSNDNGLVMIGASSTIVADTVDYESPLYDFFHLHRLDPLSDVEARQLVLALAERANTPRVVEVLERDPGRFQALYVLTGGTPRTLAMLHGVLALADESERSIEHDLGRLLDQVTPYYKARFDDLPSQSQVIVDAVALHWHPITASDVAKHTDLEVNTASAQLSRLVMTGLLTKVSLPGGSKLGFQITERFFNIWYLMRANRRLRSRLIGFVDFLRVSYGDSDLERRDDGFLRAFDQGGPVARARRRAPRDR